MVALRDAPKDTSPRKFTFGNNTYIHVPNTETFYTPGTPLDDEGNPIETLTALKIMKANFSDTRSYRRRIEPLNSSFYLLGDSARFKIIRAVQLHLATPPVNDETNLWTPFFQFLSEGVEDHWTVQQQYSSCKFVAKKDEPLATSLLLHYGWAPKYQVKMGPPCIYRLIIGDDGITIELVQDHTFGDRLFAACSTAHLMHIQCKQRGIKAQYNDLFKFASRTFFSFNGSYVSIPSDYRQAVLNKLQAFCQHLTNALAEGDPTYPMVDEPEETLIAEENKIFLSWDDFNVADELSTKQQEHLTRVHLSQFEEKFLKVAAQLDPDKEYTNVELLQYFNNDNLAKARKENYLILARQEGRRKFWKLNYERS